MSTFQIRDDHFGLTLVDAESAVEALASYVSGRATADVRERAVVAPDKCTAKVEVDGRTFYAVLRKENV